MSLKQQESSAVLDWMKWAVVIALCALIVVGNSLYSQESLFYRVAVGLAIAAIATVIAFQTVRGRQIWDLIIGARMEISRIVWPTREERNQTTLLVIAVVFVVALILWGLDSLFSKLISIVLG